MSLCLYAISSNEAIFTKFWFCVCFFFSYLLNLKHRQFRGVEGRIVYFRRSDYSFRTFLSFLLIQFSDPDYNNLEILYNKLKCH